MTCGPMLLHENKNEQANEMKRKRQMYMSVSTDRRRMSEDGESDHGK